MEIVNLNLEDGLGTVSVAVKDCLDADRIIKFMKDASKAFEANEAREAKDREE